VSSLIFQKEEGPIQGIFYALCYLLKPFLKIRNWHLI